MANRSDLSGLVAFIADGQETCPARANIKWDFGDRLSLDVKFL